MKEDLRPILDAMRKVLDAIEQCILRGVSDEDIVACAKTNLKVVHGVNCQERHAPALPVRQLGQKTSLTYTSGEIVFCCRCHQALGIMGNSGPSGTDPVGLGEAEGTPGVDGWRWVHGELRTCPSCGETFDATNDGHTCP